LVKPNRKTFPNGIPRGPPLEISSTTTVTELEGGGAEQDSSSGGNNSDSTGKRNRTRSSPTLDEGDSSVDLTVLDDDDE
jgi:hypothetical protein